MRRVVILILLALTSVSLLTGCLVHKDKNKVEHIFRTTDQLHIYQPNDYIYYYVNTISYEGSNPPTTASGTLKIEWFSSPNLIRTGANPSSIPVVKEVSTLSINGSNKGLVRYISQDSAGQITLHAVKDFTGNLDWLSPNDLTKSDPSIKNTVSYPVFYSDSTAVPPGIQFGPMPPISFHVMEGCDDGTCDNDVAQFNDSLNVVGDTTTVTTTLGVFDNPFQINFNGGITSSPPGPSSAVITDIRDICASGADGSLTEHGMNVGDGTMYVMPQVGMIQMQNTCFDTAGSTSTTHYTITISKTNIPLK
jgi:hypothetical protein